jgi:hypothetical protein
MRMQDSSDLELHFLSQLAQSAVQQQVDRVKRAEEADDVEAIIGASKELVESVGKAVIDVLGQTYPSSPDLPMLAKRTLNALELHPAGLQGRASLRKLSSAHITALTAMAELRNSDGTGHGRAKPSELDASHARLAKEAATSWCRWVLAAARRVLDGRAMLDEAVGALSNRVFKQGALPEFLEELTLSDLTKEDQHKLGLAVGRRWNIGETFNARDDVIAPMATGGETYPDAFAAGVMEGLLFDYLGYVRTTSAEIDLVVGIGLRLPDELRRQEFDNLVELIEQADASFAFSESAKVGSIERLRSRSVGLEEPVSEALGKIADRIAQFQ